MNLTLFSLTHNNRPFHAYDIDGITHVGAERNERYGIRFTSTSSETIQVSLSVDGTDVLTGHKATLEPTGKMWVVRPRGTMELVAWPEDTQGGASFVFTADDDNMVATHTHGDTRAKGIISAAIFTEGYRAPAPMFTTRGGGYSDTSYGGGMRGGSLSGMRGGFESTDEGPTRGGNLESYGGATRSAAPKGVIPGGMGTGAGERREQQIGSAQGLVRPVYSELVRLRVVPWTDLIARLTELNVQPELSFPTGFEPPLLANLGSTPRQVASEDNPRGYSRLV